MDTKLLIAYASIVVASGAIIWALGYAVFAYTKHTDSLWRHLFSMVLGILFYLGALSIIQIEHRNLTAVIVLTIVGVILACVIKLIFLLFGDKHNGDTIPDYP